MMAVTKCCHKVFMTLFITSLKTFRDFVLDVFIQEGFYRCCRTDVFVFLLQTQTSDQLLSVLYSAGHQLHVGLRSNCSLLSLSVNAEETESLVRFWRLLPQKSQTFA